MAINRTLKRDHEALLESLDSILEQAADETLCARMASDVSKWCVRDHLEHLSIANHRIVSWIEKALADHPDTERGGGPTLIGRIVLFTGRFPRGKGQAPEATRPTGLSGGDLLARLRGVRKRVQALEGSLPHIQRLGATRNHFVFGDLSAAQWLRFTVIHNNHHQRIVRDVLAAS